MSSTLPIYEYQINKILFKSITIEIDVDAGSEKEFAFMLGTEIGNDKVKALRDKYGDIDKIAKELDNVKKYWSNKLGRIKVRTDDDSFNAMVNGWYLYQTIASRLKAKAGFYQVGGAFGFRDQLQDATNIVMIDEEKTRNQILENAKHQFLQGDVLHWWHEIIMMGLRSKFKDDYLWLVYSVNRYVKVTGDYKFVDERVPFINGQQLDIDEAERGITYSYTKEDASVFEHCVIALEKSMKELGDNGLPLMGGGDWNDGMNRIGIGGKGTSVWLGFFLYYVLSDFIEIFKNRKDLNAEKYIKFLKKLKESLNTNAWDKDYYLRAFFGDGTKVGSIDSEECKIDLISQSFAILSDVIEEDKIPSVIKSVEENLVDRDLKIIKLLTPGFSKSKNNPGYIMDYPTGIRENGGQYTHSVSWYIMALIKLGYNDLAYEYYSMINPVNRTIDKKSTKVYMDEPYVISADIYSNKDHPARGGWTWYTGSAGWFYNIAITEILGLKKEGNILRIEPSVPSEWNSFDVEYKYYDTTYKIKVNFSSTNSIVVDGDKIDKNYVTLKKDKRVHAVVVNIRRKK
jgi:cellobiose phosphorylase